MTTTANPFTPVPGHNAAAQTPSQNHTLNQLLSGNPMLWRGCDMAGRGNHGLSTGYPELDAILPGRGWPADTLLEIISPHWGMGELQLLVPLMRSLSDQGKWILWVAPPYRPYAPALVQAGINTRQVLVVKTDTTCRDALWTMEKALQTESCGLVLAWQNWLPNQVLRRLQLAAQTGQTLGVLFKRHVSKDSPSPLRLKIRAYSSENERDFPGRRRARIDLLRARGNFRPQSARIILAQ